MNLVEINNRPILRRRRVRVASPQIGSAEGFYASLDFRDDLVTGPRRKDCLDSPGRSWDVDLVRHSNSFAFYAILPE